MGCRSENTNRQNSNTNGQQAVTQKVLLDVPIISQNPELANGCEVTSLAMLLRYAGVEIDKMTLADQIKKDPTPVIYEEEEIVSWGNPNDGFVGDITGNEIGFGVYTEPVLELLDQYLPNRGVDLTAKPYKEILKCIYENRPVILWVTSNFEFPTEYVEWDINGERIEVTLDEHAVLLVGYDDDYVYINNPLTGEKNQKIDKEQFFEVWNSMGSMAISYQ